MSNDLFLVLDVRVARMQAPPAMDHGQEHYYLLMRYLAMNGPALPPRAMTSIQVGS